MVELHSTRWQSNLISPAAGEVAIKGPSGRIENPRRPKLRTIEIVVVVALRDRSCPSPAPTGGMILQQQADTDLTGNEWSTIPPYPDTVAVTHSASMQDNLPAGKLTRRVFLLSGVRVERVDEKNSSATAN
jgi:hypothetical protein